MESNRSSRSVKSYTISSICSINSITLIETIYLIISISFNFDSILDIIDCYQSQCCQLNLSAKSGKNYTTGKHFSGLPIMTVATILTCDSTYLFCSIQMHCILSWKSFGSNSSVKSICNSITLIGSIYMVNSIFP